MLSVLPALLVPLGASVPSGAGAGRGPGERPGQAGGPGGTGKAVARESQAPGWAGASRRRQVSRAEQTRLPSSSVMAIS